MVSTHLVCIITPQRSKVGAQISNNGTIYHLIRNFYRYPGKNTPTATPSSSLLQCTARDHGQSTRIYRAPGKATASIGHQRCG